MVTHHSQIIFLLPWVVLGIIALTLFVQGWMIINYRNGYSVHPEVKHPEMRNVQKGDPLLTAKIKMENLSEDQYKLLQNRINELKMNELFDEPSTYEDEEEE